MIIPLGHIPAQPANNENKRGIENKLNLEFANYCEVYENQKDELSTLPFCAVIEPNALELSTTQIIDIIRTNFGQVEMSEREAEFLGLNPHLIRLTYTFSHKLISVEHIQKVILSLFVDQEEDYSILNIVGLSSLPIDEVLDFEENYFDKEFERYYTDSKGQINFRVESNAI